MITTTLVGALVCAVAVFLAWLSTDKVVYQGLASVIANNFKHYSKTHRTLTVVPFQPIDGDAVPIITSVPVKEAEAIARSVMTFRDVTVKRRAFGELRVTEIK